MELPRDYSPVYLGFVCNGMKQVIECMFLKGGWLVGRG